MAKLKDIIGEQSPEIQEIRTAVNSFKSNTDKNKMISAYVDIDRYEKFKTINGLRGISNNKILNLLIADYVLQYEKLLKENWKSKNRLKEIFRRFILWRIKHKFVAIRVKTCYNRNTDKKREYTVGETVYSKNLWTWNHIYNSIFYFKMQVLFWILGSKKENFLWVWNPKNKRFTNYWK